jgi:hypothetical protein
MEYLIPLLTNPSPSPSSSPTSPPPPPPTTITTTTTTAMGSEGNEHLQHAFNACALAWLGNRHGNGDGLPSVGGKVGGSLGKAFAEYSRALRAMQIALRDPARCRSDGVLAAVLLLGMFEVRFPPARLPSSAGWLGLCNLGWVQGALVVTNMVLMHRWGRISRRDRLGVWLGDRTSRARCSLSRLGGGVSYGPRWGCSCLLL